MFILLFLALLMGVAQADAAIHTEAVEYAHGDAVLEGYLAYEDSNQDPRPGVLVVHEWKGLNDYAKRRAEQLASAGTIAFAIDMYGKGIRPKDHQEAGHLAGIYKKDRSLMRARAAAGLEVLKNHPLTDPTRLAAIGYCFGGTTVLELARSGADLKGVVSFHGALDTPNPQDAKQIKGKVLVCHGAADTFIPAEQVAAFEKEMQEGKVDYRLIQYPGAVHSFTVPEAGDDPSKGMAYSPQADQESWNEMEHFLAQTLRLFDDDNAH